MIDAAPIIDRLRRFPAALHAAVEAVGESDAAWAPPSGNWSVLEVVCHLADEEVEDFRPRLASTLQDPAAPWTPLDLDDVSRRRGYRTRDLRAELARFSRERAASVAWLRSLTDPDWSRAHHHPRGSVIRAGDLLAAWAAHDALHLRQIAKRMHDLVSRDAPGFSPDYAGPWTA